MSNLLHHRGMSFDFSAVSVPFRMQPGLRRLAAGATQLTPNRIGDRALIEKLAVLTDHPSSALLMLPGFDATPALRELAAHASAEHPDAFDVGHDGAWHALQIGWSVRDNEVTGDGPSAIGECLRALPAEWRAAALLSLAFEEDFAVIDGATTCIPWLAVCLPSRWSPEEKVGKPFAQVHAPVADNRMLVTAAEHLARLVTGDDRWERFVWTISADGALGHHPKYRAKTPWPDVDSSTDDEARALASMAFFRTERQTFVPLPEHGQAIFTIRVQSQPLDEAITSPEHARLVRDSIASMSASVLEYRGLTSARDRLVRWLSVVSNDSR